VVYVRSGGGGKVWGGILIGEMRLFLLNNEVASVDVSRGDRTPLDYIPLQGAECAAIELGWYEGGHLER